MRGSAKIVTVQWLRMWVLGMEVPGMNSDKFFVVDIFVHLLPHSDCSIRVSQSCNFTLVWFLLYNFVAINLLLFKPSKGTATMISLCTYHFQSFSHVQFNL